MGETPEEEIADWLGRLEEEESLPEEITTFRDTLKGDLYEYTDAQVDALWEAKKSETSYEEHGIRAVPVRYSWGTELRYGIQGMAGLWSWESVQSIREAEGW